MVELAPGCFVNRYLIIAVIQEDANKPSIIHLMVGASDTSSFEVKNSAEDIIARMDAFDEKKEAELKTKTSDLVDKICGRSPAKGIAGGDFGNFGGGLGGLGGIGSA
jgi:hypothetical protein